MKNIVIACLATTLLVSVGININQRRTNKEAIDVLIQARDYVETCTSINDELTEIAKRCHERTL